MLATLHGFPGVALGVLDDVAGRIIERQRAIIDRGADGFTVGGQHPRGDGLFRVAFFQQRQLLLTSSLDRLSLVEPCQVTDEGSDERGLLTRCEPGTLAGTDAQAVALEYRLALCCSLAHGRPAFCVCLVCSYLYMCVFYS
jgi:hypothetical protein